MSLSDIGVDYKTLSDQREKLVAELLELTKRVSELNRELDVVETAMQAIEDRENCRGTGLAY